MPVFKAVRRVEFAMTDAAGIMHFAAFFPMLESVEHEFLRSLGLSVIVRDRQGTISWPRVAAQCDYRGAVRFEDVLDIELSLTRLGTKSVTYEFAVTHAEREVAVGRITAVCCRLQNDAPPVGMPIPADWVAKFRDYVVT
ncbi:MAG: thioesterase family protein [Pirellulales bacterium]